MTDEQTKIARENTVQTRRELMAKLEFLLHKGFEQAYQVDKSLLTLSGGALLLSITFVGTLSETKHCVGLLFVAWGCFVASITAVIFGMSKAQWATHQTAREAADALERFSQMTVAETAAQRATFPVGTDKPVARLNRIAILGFVLGVVFLCWFVGSNLLAESGS